MFGSQALLGIVGLGSLALRVVKRLQGRNAFVLVGIRRRIAQGLGPVAREDRGVLLRAALGRRDHDAVGFPQRRDRPAARTGHVHHKLARGRDAVEQPGKLGSGDVRPGNVELVIDSVVSAMADQHQDKGVGRLDFGGKLGEARADLFARRRHHGHHVRVAARLLQAAIDILRPHFEALIVIGLATQAGDSHVERGRRRRESCQKRQCKNAGNRSLTFAARNVHTTPHFRRSSHSAARIEINSRNTTGRSQRSRVSRVVMPASE